MGWEQGLHSALVPAVEQGQMGLRLGWEIYGASLLFFGRGSVVADPFPPHMP